MDLHTLLEMHHDARSTWLWSHQCQSCDHHWGHHFTVDFAVAPHPSPEYDFYEEQCDECDCTAKLAATLGEVQPAEARFKLPPYTEEELLF